MLGQQESPDDSDEADGTTNNKQPATIGNFTSQNPNDSYHVMMREIGVEHNDGLSYAFL